MFPVATFLVKGEIVASDVMTDALNDPEIAALEERIRLEEREEHNARFPAQRTCDVTISLKDGRVLTSANHPTLGAAENPLGPDAIGEKFRRLSGEVLAPKRIEALAQAIEALGPKNGAVADLLELASGRD